MFRFYSAAQIINFCSLEASGAFCCLKRVEHGLDLGMICQPKSTILHNLGPLESIR